VATLGRNIIANLAGGAAIAFLTVVITPLQIKLLGIDAYGLVGLITVFQIVLGVLDLGLAATITQKMAADHSPQHRDSQQLINTTATLYWGMAGAIGIALWLVAPWVAGHVLKPATRLDPDAVHYGLQTIAVYLALRWPVAFYSGFLSGIQRLDIQNAIKSAATAVRLLGGVLVLLYWAELRAFLTWFMISALIELVIYIAVCHRQSPSFRWRPSFSISIMRRHWRFSAALTLIAVISVLLTQLDRLVVSKLLGLEALGYYTLAYNTALALSLLQTALNSAALPSFAEAHGRQNRADLVARYEKTSQLMGFLVALPCSVLVFFGYDILAWWINPASARGAALPMGILAFGFFLSGMVSNAYVVAVATGRPDIPMRITLIGALAYLPLLYFAVKEGGGVGAAGAWVGLNSYYLVTVYPIVQRTLLRQALLPWLGRSLLSFLLLGAGVCGGMRLLLGTATSLPLLLSALLGVVVIYMTGGFFFLSSELRASIVSRGKRLLSLDA